MKYKINITNEVIDKVNNMTIDELLTNVTCPNYVSSKINEIHDTLCAFIHPSKMEDEINAISLIENKLGHKVLFSSDMEAGPGTAIVGATSFPSMRAVSETGDKMLAYKMGEIAAKESIKAGFSWTFAPCTDILLNHFSPITSIRSAGEKVSDVLTYPLSYMHGLQDNHMISTLKHFPGDGATQFDQHLTTAENPLTKEKWDNTYRKVYETFINEGIKAVMPGHISLSSYDEIDPLTGIYPPATLSYNLLTKLLKEDLGFEGIIISDATEMGGFCGYINYYEACARFLMSGGDILLFTHPNEEYLAEMKKLISENKLSIEVLKNRVIRILSFVNQEINIDRNISFDKEKHEEIAREVVNKSIKIYKDKANILPMIKGKKVLHVVIASNINKNVYEEFDQKLRENFIVETLIDPGCGKIKELAKSKKYDYIIVTATTFQWYGTNMITLSGVIARNMMNGWTHYGTPCIFVDFGNPYLHEEYKTMIDTLIYTYGYSSYTIDELIKKIVK